MINRVPIEQALKDPNLDEIQKTKLRRAQEAHDYALQKVHLKETSNYTTFVDLKRPYVKYVVSAAPRWKLEHYEWSYPVVGKMPYRGYSSEEEGKAEKASMENEGYDTFLRGVSAYSTLGWFKDSVLSSMLRGSEYGLVNTILHETTHTTLYIQNSADFNERLAVFVGNQASEEFYLEKEGENSPTLKKIREDNEDDRIFSSFIGPQITALKTWYENLPADQQKEELRQEKFKAIQTEFMKSVAPRMKNSSYKFFADANLNNAYLLYFRTYMEDLSDFEKLYQLTKRTWPSFIACAKTLEKSKKPAEDLKDLNSRIESQGLKAACRL